MCLPVVVSKRVSKKSQEAQSGVKQRAIVPILKPETFPISIHPNQQPFQSVAPNQHPTQVFIKDTPSLS